jgi:hypothetical protein
LGCNQGGRSGWFLECHSWKSFWSRHGHWMFFRIQKRLSDDLQVRHLLLCSVCGFETKFSVSRQLSVEKRWINIKQYQPCLVY